jgi:tripartite-type tricarboxylate transporter receptor subunit TctC
MSPPYSFIAFIGARSLGHALPRYAEGTSCDTPTQTVAPYGGYCRRRSLIAVTSATRLESMSEIPTVGDTVPGFESAQWYGVGAPAGTPAAIIATLNKEVNAALADPKMKARLDDLGGAPLSMSPEEFGKFLANETEKMGKVIKAAGISVK